MITEKMRNKLLSLFAFSIFALVFVMSAVSSQVLTLSPISVPSSVNEDTGSFTGTYNLTYTGTQADINVTFVGTSNFGSVTIPNTNISQNESKTLTATFVLPAGHGGQTMSGLINASGTGGSSAETNFSISITLISKPIIPSEITACSAIGNPGELKVKKINFKNNGLSSGVKFGDDNEWFPFEELEVEIELKNEGDDNVDDISVEWGIWDIKAQNWIIDLDDEDEINIKDGDTETLTATFTIDDDLDVDLEDLTDGENYRFYVVATGTVDNDTSPETCISDYDKASIIIENDFVIVDNIQMPETARCGETITVTADVWNIGDRDQDEVSVRITNKDLNLAENVIVGDINAFDNERISFSFSIPKNAEEKPYPITFKVYDEDGDVYKNDLNDDYSEFAFPLGVKGGCTGTSSSVTVTANLFSGGKAGEDLVVKAIITNNGSSLATYSISTSGYGKWTSSYDVEPKTLALAAGQSGEVMFTFNVNKDASGEQTFMIEIVSGDEITTQPVSILIEPSGSLFGITGFSIAGNTGLWALGFLNIILVLIIIFVAIRITRKK